MSDTAPAHNAEYVPPHGHITLWQDRDGWLLLDQRGKRISLDWELLTLFVAVYNARWFPTRNDGTGCD